MTYARYFSTGVIRSGDAFVARFDGEHLGRFATRAAAVAAIRKRERNP